MRKSSLKLIKDNVRMMDPPKAGFFQEGRAVADGFEEKDADPQQLKRGIEVEMEHTKDPAIAKKIALDHLAEISNYYTLLDQMESKAKDAANNY